MNVRSKHLDAGLFVLFQQGRASKADKHSLRQQGFHCLVQLARLRAVTFVHKNINITLGLKIFGQILLNIGNVFVNVSFAEVLTGPELVDKRADQPFFLAV